MASKPPVAFDCRQTIDELFGNVNWLYECWWMYRALYMKAPDRVDTLNEYSSVFGIYYHTLGDSILMQIAGLMAYAKGQTGDEAVTLERAISLLPETVRNERSALRKRLKGMRQKYADITDHRNSRIAHSDVDVVAKARTLNGVKFTIIAEAIKDIDELLNDTSVTQAGRGLGYMNEDRAEYLVNKLVTDLRRSLALEEPDDAT